MAELTLAGQRSEVRITRYQPQLVVSADGREHVVQPLPSDAPDRFHMRVDEDAITGVCCEDDRTIYLHMDGRHFAVAKHSILSAGLGGAMEGNICAELPGNVLSVHCAVGDKVTAGDVLLLTASMKMEVPVHADRAGVVEAILVDQGYAFERGTPLVRLSGQS
ncbi:MAG: hypothetical protein OXD00_10385 [Gammaproteobacteria bacterium]|nr:hypothetical protein [Gammaproteobacteria bacterium]